MTALHRRPRTRPVLAGTLALALSALGLGGYVPASADTRPTSATIPTTVSADPLPTWQLTGVVWSQVTVGNTVYATGAFTKARPPGVAPGGAGEITVGNLFAYDITTGNRVTTFNHSLNAAGLAITASPDGTRVYVGGDFTTVDGQTRQHVAAFDTATGALVPGFAPVANGQVKALAATNTTLYVGGAFESAGGVARKRLASFSTSNGALTSWSPRAEDGYVYSLVVTPEAQPKVVIGGQFLTLNGAAAYGMGAVDAVSGASRTWLANATIRDSGKGAINSLTTDGTYVYGSGYAFGAGASFEGSFSLNPADGSIRWLTDCLGDTYDVQPVGQVAYTASHAHDCRMIGGFPDTSPRSRWQRAAAFTSYPTRKNLGPDVYGWNYRDVPAPDLLQWYPKLSTGTASGQGQAAWDVVSNGRYVALGGEFPTVNGRAQQGLTRFALPDTAGVPNKVGPQYLDTAPVRQAAPATTASVPVTGTVRVVYGAAWDMDNTRLTYQLYRDRGTAAETLVDTRTVDSSFWVLPSQTVDDRTAPVGSHTYQVRVSDPFGNEVFSPVSNSVSTSGNAAPNAAFTASVSGLTTTLDASTSTDPDGTVASYAWTFGDGTSGTGRTASHAYTAAGTYPVSLTVTDNAGLTSTVTKSVTVASPAPAGSIAADSFRRTLATGWGTADLGGTWTTTGTSSLYGVGNGAGVIRLNAAGSGPATQLAIGSTDTALRFNFSFDKDPTGGGQQVRAIVRGTAANGYQAKVTANSAKAMSLALTKVVGGTATDLGSVTLPLTFVAGATYSIQVQAWGTGTTNLQARVWRSDSAEPATWALSRTDTTAELQVAGGIGVGAYLSGSATSAPVVLTVSGLSAGRAVR